MSVSDRAKKINGAYDEEHAIDEEDEEMAMEEGRDEMDEEMENYEVSTCSNDFFLESKVLDTL